MVVKVDVWRAYLLLFVIMFLLLSATLLVAYPTLSKPLIMDEMEFPSVAKAIVATGKPVYYRGETYPQNIGLWHPPLYILMYAFWHKVFGVSIAVSRSFGLFANFLSLVFIGFFSLRRIIGERKAELKLSSIVSIVFGLALISTSPLFIQGSVLPDIDTQLLPILSTIFLLTIFNIREKGSVFAFKAAFISLLAVNLLAKLTTPLLLVPAIIMFELSIIYLDQNKEKKSACLKASNIKVGVNRSWLLLSQLSKVSRLIFLVLVYGAFGFILMVAIWYITALIWGVNFTLPFIYLTQSANNPVSSGLGFSSTLKSIITSSPEHIRYLVQWFGFPSLFFLMLMILREFNNPSSGITSLPERVALYTYSLLIILMYIILKPAPFEFPKYHVPLLISIAILSVDFFVAIGQNFNYWRIVFLFLIETGLFIGYIYLIVPFEQRDFIYQIYWTSPRVPIFIKWIFIPISFLSLVNVFVFAKIGRAFDRLIIAIVAVLIGFNISMMYTQFIVPYSTTYLYGENSLEKVTTYLRNKLPEHVIIIAPKDVGSMLQDKWRYIELPVDPRKFFSNKEVEYLVIRSGDYYGNTIRENVDVNKAVLDTFMLETTIEEFTVFRRK